MLERIRNAATAMSSLVRRQEVTANNLANVGTAGYRRNRVFETMLEAQIGEDGIPSSTRQLVERVDPTEGSLEFSDRSLDVAIIGDGYFVLADPTTESELYTRAGRFQRNTQGQLVNPAGLTVMGESGPIVIPEDAESIVIAPNGQVKAGPQVVGKLRVVQFESVEDLERRDGSTFASTVEAADIEHPELKQRYLESSNVNAMSELSDMIVTSRLFESQQRVLRSIDQALERATRDLGQY